MCCRKIKKNHQRAVDKIVRASKNLTDADYRKHDVPSWMYSNLALRKAGVYLHQGDVVLIAIEVMTMCVMFPIRVFFSDGKANILMHRKDALHFQMVYESYVATFAAQE